LNRRKARKSAGLLEFCGLLAFDFLNSFFGVFKGKIGEKGRYWPKLLQKFGRGNF